MKPFTTLEEQIALLKSRNLLFLDEETAIKAMATKM
jgi:abortive infection bacteriophage resistance protein